MSAFMVLYEQYSKMTPDLETELLSSISSSEFYFDTKFIESFLKCSSMFEACYILRQLNIDEVNNDKMTSNIVAYAFISKQQISKKSKTIRSVPNEQFWLEYLDVKEPEHGKGYGSYLINIITVDYPKYYVNACDHSVGFYLKQGFKALEYDDWGFTMIKTR